MKWEETRNDLKRCRCGSDNVCYNEKLFLDPEAVCGVVMKRQAICLDCKKHTKWYKKESQARNAWNKRS